MASVTSWMLPVTPVQDELATRPKDSGPRGPPRRRAGGSRRRTSPPAASAETVCPDSRSRSSGGPAAGSRRSSGAGRRGRRPDDRGPLGPPDPVAGDGPVEAADAGELLDDAEFLLAAPDHIGRGGESFLGGRPGRRGVAQSPSQHVDEVVCFEGSRRSITVLGVGRPRLLDRHGRRSDGRVGELRTHDRLPPARIDRKTSTAESYEQQRRAAASRRDQLATSRKPRAPTTSGVTGPA